MALHAVRSADHKHCRVQNLQRPLRFRRKIRVAGRVKNRDGEPRQSEPCLLRKDRDAPLPLLIVRIQMRVAVVDASGCADLSGSEEHGFRQCCLSGVHMRKDADGPCLIHHVLPSLPVSAQIRIARERRLRAQRRSGVPSAEIDKIRFRRIHRAHLHDPEDRAFPSIGHHVSDLHLCRDLRPGAVGERPCLR